MSYALTTQQFIDDCKDVTRRLGWSNLCPNEHYMAVRKAMGLKPGEKIQPLGECICTSNTPEQLDYIIEKPYRDGNPKSEMEREGFPQMSAEEFVDFFCVHMKVTPKTYVNRITFMKVKPKGII